MNRVYLDHAATTPLRPEARAAMEEGFRLWANPSSPHAEGRKAREMLEDARERIKTSLGWEGELIFTSGASEAAELAFGAAKAGERLVSAVEHEGITRAAPDAVALPIGSDGALDLPLLQHHLKAADAALVAVQTINSETGNLQDLDAIGEQVHGEGALLLADASQSAGKLKLPHSADMVIVSAHKLGGPVGIGALLVRDYALLAPAGGQERGYRRGTENLPGALGFAAALEASGDVYLPANVLEPVDALADQVRALGGTWLSDGLAHPTPLIRAVAMPGLPASAQLMRFDLAGFAVSQGSACSSGSMRPSAVLEAMGLDPDLAARTIRVSFGWNTAPEEVERFTRAWTDIARQVLERAA